MIKLRGTAKQLYIFDPLFKCCNQICAVETVVWLYDDQHQVMYCCSWPKMSRKFCFLSKDGLILQDYQPRFWPQSPSLIEANVVLFLDRIS